MTIKTWYRHQRGHLVHRRGVALARQGNHDAAIETLHRALADHPEPVSLYLALAHSHAQLGDLEAAQHCLQLAIDQAANPAEAYYRRGKLRASQAPAAAMADWQAALTANPRHGGAHYCCGLRQYQQQNYAAALDHLNETLAVQPNWGEAYLYRGHARQQLGDLAGAQADWQLAACNDATLRSQIPTQPPKDMLRVERCLQEQLQPLTVDVQRQGRTLHIRLHRQVGQGVSYFDLPDRLRGLLLPLELGEITQFCLTGYVGDVRRPEWEKTYDLYINQPCPPSHWLVALTALATFPPLGVTALLYARQVQQFYQRGNYPDALRASRAVKRLMLVGTGAMCAMAALPLGYTSIESIRNEPAPPQRAARVIDHGPSSFQ